MRVRQTDNSILVKYSVVLGGNPLCAIDGIEYRGNDIVGSDGPGTLVCFLAYFLRFKCFTEATSYHVEELALALL